MTFGWFFSRVLETVVSEGGGAGEAAAAHRATVRFDWRVYGEMVAEVVLVRESLAADVAGKGLVLDVGFPVIFQEIHAVETLVTTSTLVLLLGVESQVSVKRFLVRKRRFTLRTGFKVVHVYDVVTEVLSSGESSVAMGALVKLVLSLTPGIRLDVGHVYLYIHQDLLYVLGGFVLAWNS